MDETTVNRLAPSLKGIIMQVIFQVRVGGCRHLEHDLAAAAADVLDKLPAAEAKDLTSAMQQQTTSRES